MAPMRTVGSVPTVVCALGMMASFVLGGCTPTPPPISARSTGLPENRTPLAADVLGQMWKVQEGELRTATGEPVVLRGIAFGNHVWDDEVIPSSHHSKEDFARVARMGMNSVRFYLNYRTFEDDSSPGTYHEQGFAWVDQNVEWAKAHGVRLILNMHVPPGGYQSQGKGSALWESQELQERFVLLWRAIAERYRAEPTIVGYDILNEPHPTRAKHQWEKLANRTVSSIREVDQHHVLFVERVNAIAGDWSEDEDRNFFLVDDPNVVYEFHFYKPFHFTHQNAPWSDFAARESHYPDDQAPEVEWFLLQPQARAESEKLPTGDSEWTLLETEPFLVTDERIALGKPYLVCDDAEGRGVFDTLSLSERNAASTETASESPAPTSAQDAALKAASSWQTVFEVDLDTERGWYFYHPSGKGAADFVARGQGDQTALAIFGTEGQANLGSDPLRFFARKGHEYQLSGVARGMGLSEKANCRLRLEFYSSKVPVLPRDKTYLAQEVDAYLAWGKKHEVPLYLGEFGTIRDSFLPGRGGLDWVRDMLELLEERQVSFAYHDYHELAFGLFVGDRGLPSVYSANLPLYELFVKTLVGPDADASLIPGQKPSPSEDAEPEQEAPEPEVESVTTQKQPASAGGTLDFD